jgi:8-oxo-dGTP diphosphatase
MREAVVIVLVRDGRVLVIRRAAGIPRPGYWSPPTGHVEAGEGAAAAVVREAMEELGMAVTPIAHVWTNLSDDRRYRLLWWLAEPGPGDPVANAREVAEWRWIAARDFQSLRPTFASHRRFFAEILPAL